MTSEKEVEKVKPSPPKTMSKNHIKLCNMLADPEYRMLTKTSLAEKLGISRPTLYKYLERKDVQDYTRKLVDYYTDGELANVWKSLIRQCKRGDTRAIKLYYEMKQLYIPPQQVVDLQMKDAKATINIISNIPRPEEKEEEN